MSGLNFSFTSESVAEGHPDKVCDYIADSVLDAHLAQDPRARVACEVLCKSNHVVLAGEITSRAQNIDYPAIVNQAVRTIGYTDPALSFHVGNLDIQVLLTEQAGEIAQRVIKTAANKEQGAGDQGLMLGYASDETPELMPLPVLLAHRVALRLTTGRRNGAPWLRPDAKTQVSVEYENGAPRRVTAVVVSTMHERAASQEQIRDYVLGEVLPDALGAWWNTGITVHVNPSGSFVDGGPSADAGVTGRKIIVDTYGGFSRHGGGAFSGKDPSKVDRSGAYFCRWVARQIVAQQLARRAEVQVAYAIGVAQPMSVFVETFGTGDQARAEAFVRGLDFRPEAIIEQFELLRPIYRQTTNYGHFGRPGLPWET
jgi:S-adenosylmethionine synthetase